MAEDGGLRDSLRGAAPHLTQQLDALCDKWLSGLIAGLTAGDGHFRPKQINDPIWGTIELLPREVGLLDSKLLQRMRGVRQLGLAQLVFPSASHDRLEHIVGVVGAVERMADALDRQVTRWNAEQKRQGRSTEAIPTVDDEDREVLRLAALFHDLGHGPFSHALEPVLDVTSPLGMHTDDGAEDWRRELVLVRRLLLRSYSINGLPALSEVIAVMVVLSETVTGVLAHGMFRIGELSARNLQERLVAAILGGVQGPGTTHLSTMISGQVDADRLDFLARDAHHAGLEVGFEKTRVLSKLEVLQIRDDNLDTADETLRGRVADSPGGVVHQIGIAASGYGSLEQMLIGRTFLYDRLYHHHKVRAAEAMAQRMLLVAERDRGRRFSLGEIFLSVGDDTFLRIIAGEVSHPDLTIDSPSASTLARGILERELLHRAFAFRGRFIAAPSGLRNETADANRDAQWTSIVKRLDGLQGRYTIGREIHRTAVDIASTLKDAGVDIELMDALLDGLTRWNSDHVIVDLPNRKANAIRILARYPDGTLKLPEFSFNPQNWANVYDLQKRTGYVFCRKEVIPVVALASRIVFLREFGVVMAKESDGYIKAVHALKASWADALVEQKLLDRETVELLTGRRHSMLRVRSEDLRVPEPWLSEDPDFAAQLATNLNQYLSGGLTLAGRDALGKALEALWRLVDSWYSGPRVASKLASEQELQTMLAEHFRATLHVDEGTEVGGGEIDLLLERHVLVENKFHGRAANPAAVAKSAGMQGRRYGLALNSQLVVVIAARRVPVSTTVPSKIRAVAIKRIASEDRNRVELRVDLPFGAVLPSSETPEIDA